MKDDSVDESPTQLRGMSLAEYVPKDMKIALLIRDSANGLKRRSQSTLNQFPASIFVLKLLVMAELMLSISSKRLDAVYRSRAAVPDLWSMAQAVRVMKTCISTLREYGRFRY